MDGVGQHTECEGKADRAAQRPGRRDRASAPARPKVWDVSGTGPRGGPAGATAPARRKARKPSERSERPAPEGKQRVARRLRDMNRPTARELTQNPRREMSAGPGRKARKPSERSERPAPEGKQKTLPPGG